MRMNNLSSSAIRNSPGVTTFVSIVSVPYPTSGMAKQRLRALRLGQNVLHATQQSFIGYVFYINILIHF